MAPEPAAGFLDRFELENSSAEEGPRRGTCDKKIEVFGGANLRGEAG